jgi:bisphosphoglycerate-dependent phosphoglycerate mutase
VTAALVTFLWNLIRHGESTVDWETSLRFAIIFDIILTWAKSREIKENLIIQKSKTTERRKK